MRLVSARQKIKKIQQASRRSRKARRRSHSRSVRGIRLKVLIEQNIGFLDAPPIHRNRIPLKVPEILSLKENYGETMKVINDLRHYALDHFLAVDLYFDFVEYVEPAALMVLAAEIHRCRNLRRKYGQPIVSGTYPREPQIYRQLSRAGFFKLLKLKDDHVPPDDGDAQAIVIVPFITDREATAVRAANFIDILVEMTSGTIEMDDRHQRYLQGALVEAMKNAGEHAYRLKAPHQPMGRRWWLSAAFDVGQREVSIMLFDQGAGIPATLEPSLLSRVASIARLEGIQPRDSLMIEIATRPGETSTRQAGRGLGFHTMRKFVDSCEDGELFVYSNAGHYMYSRAATSRGDEALSLGGTLIQWRFRHSSVLNVAEL